ncbi:MAG: tetratricopeptide repeat protein [Pyrinomonadaceae bacterium]
MKKVLFLVFILIFSLNVFAQNADFDLSNYGVNIEPDKRLIVVLASLEAAGLETPLTEKGVDFRQKLQADLKDLNPELRQKLKTFIDQYKRRHANASQAEIIAPFVSMAYTLSPVPDLAEPSRATDLPGDLLEVLDYSPLVREFYRRSALNTKLDDYVRIYQSAGDDMRKSARIMISDLLDYLHTKPQLISIDRIKTDSKNAKGKKTLQKTEIRERTRRFVIVPEMLASKGTINFVNARDDYFAIVPPETDLAASEVRRAYLQFVFDPLVLKNAKDISTFSTGIRALLDERRKENPNISPDIYLAVLRSLIAAADARQIEFKKTRIGTAQARQKIDQMKTVDEKKAVSAELGAFKKSLADETAVSLSEAYQKGAVLAFYFAEQLKGAEDSGFDIASSLHDIILSLDPIKETNRLTQFAEARKRGLTAREERRKNAGNAPTITENPVTKKLLEVDTVIKEKNYPEAETQLKQLLQAYPTDATRIYYSLGRVASLSAEDINEPEARKNRLLESKIFYENVIRSATTKTDKELLSLTYVALARIYEFYGENEYAVKLYEAAIKNGNAASQSYKEAVAARERLMKEQ